MPDPAGQATLVRILVLREPATERIATILDAEGHRPPAGRAVVTDVCEEHRYPRGERLIPMSLPESVEAEVRTFATLANEIQARPAPVTPRLVAVDGRSGAGKSTFAKRLAHALDGAPIVELDDFISWHDLASWWPRFEEQVLVPLVAGRAAVYQQRDWVNDPFGDRLRGFQTLPVSSVLIVEGVTASRREIADRLTFAVWIDTPRQVRLSRGIERDGEQMRAIWLDWMEREDDFFTQDNTPRRANLIVEGLPTVPHSADSEFVCRPFSSEVPQL